MFRDGWIILNKIPIHVCTWGCWIEDDIPGDSVLLCVPGNPGVTDFYYEFLSTLQPLIDLPVWLLCHGGFESPPYGLELPNMKSNPELYNLAGQIEQKREFIKTYIPLSKKIYLVGHSVGGKVCIELLKDNDIADKTEQAHLMFPCLEHIGETPNGKVFINVVQYIVPFLVFIAWVFSILPRILKVNFLSLFYLLHPAWNCNKEKWLEGSLNFCKPFSVSTALFLAFDEIAMIKDLDNEIYEKYHSKLYTYYAQSDRWAPLSQYEHLMEKHPKVKGVILEKKFTHSFVLTTGVDMAQMLHKAIRPCGNQKKII